MVQNREPFLSRWSRRKRSSAHAAPEPKLPAQAEGPPPELPPIDSLTPESDFSAFMHKQVDEKLRRAALQKLFSDPAFNVVDGLDDYAEDYTQLETLAEGAAATLEHAKRTLRGGDAAPETERTETESQTLAQAEGAATPPADAAATDPAAPANHAGKARDANDSNAARDAGPEADPPSPADATAPEKR
jgi:hypothetical protein